MKIENHISALLYRYQCVTVPGFGAFLTEIQSAHLNDATHTFFPPKKLLSFNPHLKNNDGLLANHIALQEKISYDVAVVAIEREVAAWVAKLQQREVLSLPNIGTLVVNSEWNWVFEPITNINYLSEAFGLSTVVSPAVTREALKIQVEALEEKAPIVFTPERKKSYSYLKYAAVFTVMMGVGASAFQYQHNTTVAEELLVREKKVQEKVQHKIQEATFFIENPLPAVTLNVNLASGVKPYHVVAGSFRNENNATKIFDELKHLGYEPIRLEKNAFGLYPVLYGSYSSYKEAQDIMKQIHTTHNKEAWVLIKEL